MAVAFNLWRLYPEVAIQAPPLNDTVMHRSSWDGRSWPWPPGRTSPIRGWRRSLRWATRSSIITSTCPICPWRRCPPWLTLVFRAAVSPAALVNWTAYLLLEPIPPVDLLVDAAVRLLSPAGRLRRAGELPDRHERLFGLEYSSYVWRGYGLYTQLWGMFLLPIALAQCYVTLRDGRGYFWSVLLVAAMVLSHLFSGYLVLGSIVLLALLVRLGEARPAPRRRHARRSAARLLLLLLLVAAGYLLFRGPVRPGRRLQEPERLGARRE